MSEATHELRGEGLSGVLDALVAAVESARSMPMSSSVIVNKAELLELVSLARATLPAELVAADALIADTDAARASAHAEAESIVARAHEEATALVEQDAVVHEAQSRAAQIVADAQAEAAEQRRGADDYCDRRLADFEIDLGKVLSQVQAGRAKLAGRLGQSF